MIKTGTISADGRKINIASNKKSSNEDSFVDYNLDCRIIPEELKKIIDKHLKEMDFSKIGKETL